MDYEHIRIAALHRIRELEKRCEAKDRILKKMSEQKIGNELSDDEREDADFEVGYTELVKMAREALKK